MAEPLRNVLWGEHSIAVLLPGGEEPIKVVVAVEARLLGIGLSGWRFQHTRLQPPDCVPNG